jgi:hypothetical protein
MKKNYKIGDFFTIPLDNGKQKGYGRIIGIHKGWKVPAIEYYKVNPRKNYTIDELLKAEYIKRVLCFGKPFKSEEFKIIGNAHIEYNQLTFWQYSDHFEKYFIIDDEGNFEESIPKDDIKSDWIEFSIYYKDGLIQQYTHYLSECGLFSPII